MSDIFLGFPLLSIRPEYFNVKKSDEGRARQMKEVMEKEGIITHV
jgi:hypothetical protein